MLDAKRKKQISPKAGEKRKAMFASADNYDQIVKQAIAKQAKSFEHTKGEKLQHKGREAEKAATVAILSCSLDKGSKPNQICRVQRRCRIERSVNPSLSRCLKHCKYARGLQLLVLAAAR